MTLPASPYVLSNIPNLLNGALRLLVADFASQRLFYYPGLVVPLETFKDQVMSMIVLIAFDQSYHS